MTLGQVTIDAIDVTLDVVFAQAAAVMASRAKARAGVGDEIASRVELHRSARVGESPAAERAIGQVAF